MLFVILAYDKADGSAIRSSALAAHLEHLEGAGDRLKLAGPLLDAEEKMLGSLIVVDAASETAARLFAENDPFSQAGLFERVEIRPFSALLGRWARLEG